MEVKGKMIRRGMRASGNAKEEEGRRGGEGRGRGREKQESYTTFYLLVWIEQFPGFFSFRSEKGPMSRRTFG